LESLIIDRWRESDTMQAVLRGAEDTQFLPPIDRREEGDDNHKLVIRLLRMGVLSRRSDGRYDMPDLFRVAARLLRKGGVTPT
jgi:hypothetical protein